MSDLLFAFGLIVVLFTAASVLFTIVLPREPRGFERLSSYVNRLVQVVFIGLSRLARTYEGKDALLAPTAPVALVAQLAFWASCFIIGYALMLEGTTHSLVSALAQASGAVFTVGTVDLSGPPNSALDIAAGATWVIIDTLPNFYASWEEWSADLAESHTTYPVMLLFRSPDPWFSWLVGLLAVLDGAAMHIALAPSTASSQSRLCLRMGFTALNRIAKVLRWDVDPDPNPEGPIDLTFGEFEEAVTMLEHVGFPMERTAEEAWPDFRGWRVNYETVAYRLCDRLTAPPAPWSGRRRHLRSGVVAPRRPPQRAPGVLAQHRPEVVIPPTGHRRGGYPKT